MYRARVRAAVAVLAAIATLVVSCGKSDKSGGKAPPPAGSGTGSGTAATAPAQPPGTVAVFVDDKQVASLDPATIATWPRIDAVVPVAAQRLGTWDSITLHGATDFTIAHPSDTNANRVPAVFADPDYGPAFGMFDLVELAQKHKPTTVYPKISEVRIKLVADSDRGQNEDGAKTFVDPTKLDLAIEGGTVAHLTGTMIIGLPRVAPPNGDTANQGWPLTAFLDAAGVKSPKNLLLADAQGTTLKLTAAQLDPAASVPFIKLNKQGQLRLRVYAKQGDGWVIAGDLRGLASIKVVK